jgi:hypothetical protein
VGGGLALVLIVVMLLGRTQSGGADEAARGEQLDGQAPAPESKAPADKVVSKEEQLGEFQKANDISDQVVAAAIKEWTATHDGGPDWSLEEVEMICLRNKRDGIPEKYLPESEKDKE